MTIQDNLATSAEFIQTKKKCDKQKREIDQLQKQLSKLMDIEIKHDILTELVSDQKNEAE